MRWASSLRRYLRYTLGQPQAGGLTDAPMLVLRQLGPYARPTDIGIRSLQPRACARSVSLGSRDFLGLEASLRLSAARRAA